MKFAHQLTTQPVFGNSPVHTLAGTGLQHYAVRLRHAAAARLRRSRQVLISAGGFLFLALLFLGCSYLFFIQLATFGW